MSLTRYLNQTHIRSLFKEHITNPDIHKGLVEIRILSKTSAPGLVGTAFDYYFRFQIELLHFKKFSSDPRPLEDIIERYNLHTSKIGTEFDENANNAMMKVLKKKSDISTMIEHSINYAIMDTFYRSGYSVELKQTDKKVIADEIADLIKMVPFESFKPNKRIVSGPRFGLAAPLGGADADLIIDSALLDLKTVSTIKDPHDIINQLYGYWFFSLLNIEQEPGDKESEIDSLGVYFARHGILRTFDPTKYITPASQQLLLNQIKTDIGWEKESRKINKKRSPSQNRKPRKLK